MPVMLNETPGDFVSKGSFDIFFAPVLVLGRLAVCAPKAQSPCVFVATIDLALHQLDRSESRTCPWQNEKVRHSVSMLSGRLREHWHAMLVFHLVAHPR